MSDPGVAFGSGACPVPHVDTDRVQLGHGSGGDLSAALLRDVVLPALGSPTVLEDAAEVTLPGATISALSASGRAAPALRFTTDSFVVSPRWFPGGDLGSLALHGTVNDLAVAGASPLAIGAALIVEEGFPVDELSGLLRSLGDAARRADVPVVTGDTKVVGRGAADGIFITTSGVGVAFDGSAVSAAGARPGDTVIISGPVAAHGMAVVCAREDLGFSSELQSDSRPLHRLVETMVATAGPQLHAMRDPTRGGLASALNELAAASAVAVHIDEASVPVEPAAAAACELLGFDPLHVANEGCLVAIVAAESADAVLDAMRGRPEGRAACVVGEVRAAPAGRVTASTVTGGERIVDMLVGEQLPRIC